MTYRPIEGTLEQQSEVGIILPTYCEAENITKLIDEIESLDLNTSVLLIDDSSPDGTANLVRTLQSQYGNILIFVRPRKSGLGTAITDGFKIFLSLKNPPKYIITMDADYSHSPQDILRLLSVANNTGIVIGSRYCPGGGAVNWSITRLLLSRVANLISSALIEADIHDYTSGLRCYSTELVKNMINDLHSETYEIQEETIRQAKIKGFAVKEVPMIFINRKKGKSKLSKKEIQEFISYTFNVLLSRK
ncbi:polyprenol monophosphomannose synthase [Candidatus Bathyarchaeota archaeon]|nr:polyprenol monophosphomannose synthase [Candidatus Bathyarchaeota archaeon]